jgi:hypothetical protein
MAAPKPVPQVPPPPPIPKIPPVSPRPPGSEKPGPHKPPNNPPIKPPNPPPGPLPGQNPETVFYELRKLPGVLHDSKGIRRIQQKNLSPFTTKASESPKTAASVLANHNAFVTLAIVAVIAIVLFGNKRF